MKKKRKRVSIRGRNRLQKMLMVMKLTFFLTVFMVGTLHASVNAQLRLTMNLGEANLKEVFDEIQRQTSKTVIYNNERLDLGRMIKADFNDMELDAVLDEVLSGSGMGYKLVNDYIVIVPQKEEKENFTSQTVKEKTIKGVVKDEEGSLLPGVTVLIKGTTIGTATDVNGSFSLQVPDMPEMILVFSMVGMETQELKPGAKTELSVIMKLSEKHLDEVVVTGIVERKAESFTGSAVTMNNDELKRVGNANVFQSLKNLDPSLMIFDNMQFGSDPNKTPEMTLRGASSIDMGSEDIDIKGSYANDPNAPLFILDGFEATVQKIMDLDMDRIESLTILKDASAKAIYGSRAANGVIVIETKQAEGGDLRVTYSGNVTFEVPDLTSYNLTNAAQKLELEKDFGLYEVQNPDSDIQGDIDAKNLYNSKYKAVVAGVNTDWLAKPLQVGVGQKHSLSIELGGKDLRVLADFSYNHVVGQ